MEEPALRPAFNWNLSRRRIDPKFHTRTQLAINDQSFVRAQPDTLAPARRRRFEEDIDDFLVSNVHYIPLNNSENTAFSERFIFNTLDWKFNIFGHRANLRKCSHSIKPMAASGCSVISVFFEAIIHDNGTGLRPDHKSEFRIENLPAGARLTK
jgi:hypothetical protein